MPAKKKSPAGARKRGLATVSKAKRVEIARKGNAAARAAGKVHQWSSEEAREAGHKGGSARAHPEDAILAQLARQPEPNILIENEIAIAKHADEVDAALAAQKGE